MKVTPILLPLLAAASAHAARPSLAKSVLTCRVASIIEQNNPWEKGLGVYGSWAADDDSESVVITSGGAVPLSVQVGQMHWIEGDDNVLIKTKLLPNQRGETYEIRRPFDAQLIQVNVYASERGVVLVKPDRTWLTVATFDCHSTKAVETAKFVDGQVAGAALVSREELPAIVRKNIVSTNFPEELGIGLWRVEAERIYRVVDEAAHTEGYVAWEKIRHTNGDGQSDEIILRFDRNGLRLKSPDIVERPPGEAPAGYPFP